MSTNYLLTEDQLLCCICLEVFTDPVTLPCGHNFCKACITQHLNFNHQHRCPMCKEHVDRKYKLGVNTFISEMAVQFRRSAGRKASGGVELQHTAAEKPSLLPSGPKRTKPRLWVVSALGLLCLTLLAVTYQTLHQPLYGLKTSQRADSMCRRHHRPLQLYCKNEQKPVCRACAESTHRFHHVVSLENEYEAARVELGKSEADLQQRIQERELKIQELERSVKLSREAGVAEKAHSAMVFSSLIQSLEMAQAELFRAIEQRQEATERQVRGFIEELELELSELSRRRAKVEQLWRLTDPLHFLQDLPSLDADAPTRDWADISICPEFYEGMMRMALLTAVNQLTETVAREMKNQQEAELQRAEQFAVDVTLDVDTAHPALILSDDGKQVHCGDVDEKHADSSKRFPQTPSVVAKQSFSCGKFHYDVGLKGKTAWAIGVAQHMVRRTGRTKLKPDNGYWTLTLHNRTVCFALENRPVPIPVEAPPERVKVFVSYEEGLVSFYDIDAAALLYSFKGCSFTGRLYPFFSPGSSDAAPLVISPVQ